MSIITQYNQQNLFNLHNRIDCLVNDYSKLLVIRIDFGIQQDMGMEVHSSFMKEAFTRLRNNMRNQPLFNHLVSYVAKLEYAPDKSWHYHVIFFFNGQLVQRDCWLSQQIGNYWNTVITRGIGVYYSANLHHEDYLFNGIGMIEHQDTQKINHLKLTAQYLTKIDDNIQGIHLTNDGSRTIRTFFMSEYQPKQKNKGRPRNTVD